MADDLTKPSDVVFPTLIAKFNPKFRMSYWPHVNYMSVTPITGERNTRLTVEVKEDSGWVDDGSVDITYNRVDLAALDNLSYTSSIIPVGTSVYAMTAELIAKIGMNLGVDDVEDAVIVGTPEESLYNTLTLTAKPNGLVYIGSHIFRVSKLPHISTLFTTNVLPGF